MPRAFNVVYRLSCHLSSIAFALFCLLSASTVLLCLFCFVLPIFSHLLRAASSSSKYLTFIMGYPSQAGGQVKSAIWVGHGLRDTILVRALHGILERNPDLGNRSLSCAWPECVWTLKVLFGLPCPALWLGCCSAHYVTFFAALQLAHVELIVNSAPPPSPVDDISLASLCHRAQSTMPPSVDPGS